MISGSTPNDFWHPTGSWFAPSLAPWDPSFGQLDHARIETQPGQWCLNAQIVSRRDRHDLSDDVKLFFILVNALMDASSFAARRFGHGEAHV